MKTILLLIAALAAGSQQPDTLALRSGASIAVQIRRTVKADKARIGDEVLTEVTVPVLQDGRVVIPKGARVVGQVTAASAHTKAHPESVLAVRFERAQWKQGSVALNAFIVRPLSLPQPKKKVVQYDRMNCIPVMRLLPQQQSGQTGGPPVNPPNTGPPPQPIHGVQPPCMPGGGREVDSPEPVPGLPKLESVFVRTLDNPLGPTELTSNTKNVTLPSGLIVELRHIAP